MAETSVKALPPSRRVRPVSSLCCPECGESTAVTDSRPTPGGVRRRRCCTQGHRFTTYEAANLPHPAEMQIKRAVSLLRQFAAELEAQIGEC